MDYLPPSKNRPIQEEGPLITEGIIGFRIFRIGLKQESGQKPVPRLRSLAVDSYWQPGLNQASCQFNGNKAPEDNCHCGFNAYYHLGEKFLVHEGFFQHFALAAILGGGEVRLHRDGFRAEKAAIIGLLYNQLLSKPEEEEIQNQLTNEYRVPLCLNRDDLIKKTKDIGIMINSAEEIVNLKDSPNYSRNYQAGNGRPQITVADNIQAISLYAPIDFYYEFLNEDKNFNPQPKKDQLIKKKGVEIIKKDLGKSSGLIKFLAQKNRGPIALAVAVALAALLLTSILLSPVQGPLNLIILLIAIMIIPFIFIFVLEKAEAFLRKRPLNVLQEKFYI